MKKFFETNLSEKIKHEWEMKEYGSFEDAGCPKSGHIVNVLNTSSKGRIVANNQEELDLIEKSASYHAGAWDYDQPIVIAFMRSCGRISGLINKLKTTA